MNSDKELEDYIKNTDDNSVRWFILLRQQHTELHHLLYKFPRGASKSIIKSDIARIINSLSQILANLE